jgi:hypothetical protein
MSKGICKESIVKNLLKFDIKIKGHINTWRDIPCSLFRNLTIVKISVLTNFFLETKDISTEIPGFYFVDINH